MKADVKEKWVAALRSDEYPQTIGVLISVDDDGKPAGYCCLGVLCDLAVKAGVSGVRITDQVSPHRDSILIEVFDEECEEWLPQEDQHLPLPVEKWAELEHPDPHIGSGGVHISQYNDGSVHHGLGPHSFEEIATLIEENL